MKILGIILVLALVALIVIIARRLKDRDGDGDIDLKDVKLTAEDVVYLNKPEGYEATQIAKLN